MPNNPVFPSIYDNQTSTAKALTTDATPLAAWSFTIPQDDFIGRVTADIVARSEDGSTRAAYTRQFTYWCASGTAGNDTVRTIGTDYESDANLNATIDVSSGVVRVMVTGLGGGTNLQWLVSACNVQL